MNTYEGAGIGLTIVQKICEKLQINLEAESKQQGGSTFILSWEK